jgi:GDP-D-mannose 3',5'-epimerase
VTRRVLVAGGSGFIGNTLAEHLKSAGNWVRVADIHSPPFSPSPADELLRLDLREYDACAKAVEGIDDVYQLAADMGGIGYITTQHAALTRSNILINAHMLEASRKAAVKRYLFTSSACVYPSHRQNDAEVTPLKESDAIPADPEKGYGWEKLFAEQLTGYYHEEFGLDTRVARFHNIYGPFGTFEGGREKAPAALCRKVALAAENSSIEVWGDGGQTRSFCYITDCVDGLVRLMDSGETEPLNLGSEELVTIHELAQMIIGISGKSLKVTTDPSKPQGVRGRNSDNRLLRETLHWVPQVPLSVGLTHTYQWIWSQLAAARRASPPAPLPTATKAGRAGAASP